MKDKIKQAVENALNHKDAFTKCDTVKNQEQCVILVNGKRVRMRSGKSIWNGRGPAKNALRNHIAELYCKAPSQVHINYIINEDGRKDYSATQDAIKEAENEWIEKHVVFVPYAEYLATQRKRSK